MSESEMVNGGRYDLCVVGAGDAGLKAAFVASRYLPANARVLLLDKHQQVIRRRCNGLQRPSD